MPNNIEKRLENLVCEILEIDKKNLEGKKDADFFKDLKIDSLLALEMIAAAERKFNIKIKDEEITKLSTFNKLVNLIHNKLSRKRKKKKKQKGR